MEEVLRCSNCAGPRESGDSKCTYCGYSFVKPVSNLDPTLAILNGRYATESRTFEEYLNVGKFYVGWDHLRDWKSTFLVWSAIFGVSLLAGILAAHFNHWNLF